MNKIIKRLLITVTALSICAAAWAEDASDTTDDAISASSGDVTSDSTLTVKKRKSSAKNESEHRMFLTIGGGLGINLPAIDIVHDGYINLNDGVSKDSTFAAFGVNLFANATFSYRLDKGWGIGAAVNLGYNIMGGPHALYQVKYQSKEIRNTLKGFGKLYHSFTGDINFMARTPEKHCGDIILEAGVRLMPTYSALVYRENGETVTGKSAYSKDAYNNPITGNEESFYYPGTESAMMAGPNIFIGVDYFLKDYLDIIGGLRIAAVFGCADTYYIDNGITDRSYLNSIITIAFEARINWSRTF